MKLEKVIVPVSVSVAVVVAAVAAIVVTNNRATIARLNNEAEEHRAHVMDMVVKTNELAATKASADAKAAEEDRIRSENDLLAKSNETVRVEAEKAAKEAGMKMAEANAKAKRDEAKRAAEVKETAKLTNELAKIEFQKLQVRLNKEIACSNAAAAEAASKLELEKRRSEAIIAEAKHKELQKIEFEKWQRDLIEYRQQLDERERALHPDISIYDSTNITWVADREAEVIGGVSNLVRKAAVLPENDPSLTPAARELARIDRLAHEVHTNRVSASKARMLETLERLRDAAVREGRTLDADFYQKSIRSLYPDYQQ